MKRLLIYQYLFMMAVFVVINFFVSPLYWHIVTKSIERQQGIFWADITRGFFHVIEAELNRVSVEDWDASIKTMQSHFAFPLPQQKMPIHPPMCCFQALCSLIDY